MILCGAVPYVQERLIEQETYYSYLKFLDGIDQTPATFTRRSPAVVALGLDNAVYDSADRTLIFLVNRSTSEVAARVQFDVSRVSADNRDSAVLYRLNENKACPYGLDLNGEFEITLAPLDAAVVVMKG